MKILQEVVDEELLKVIRTFLKHMGPKLRLLVSKLFTKIITLGEYPRTWHPARVALIFKSKERDLLDNY